MPKPDELLFAFKTFTGAMAALYLSLWLGLDNPYWAMATAFIVAQPFSGAMRSKALYRLGGTAIGGTAAVAMVPNLVNAPVLLSLALALWLGMCLYFSLLDRSPRAYTFMLAGYTAGIIGFPSVTAPQHIFQTALTRVEEISIGITCTTAFGLLVFPRPLGPVLARRMAGWTKPAVNWAVAALSGHDDSAAARDGRAHLAFEAIDTSAMIDLLAYDTSHLRDSVPYVSRLRVYLISLLPILSSIGDRVAQLYRLSGITPGLQHALDRTVAWMHGGTPEEADALLAEIVALEEAEHDWPGLLRASLALRLEELVSLAKHSREIRQHILHGEPPPEGQLERDFVAVVVHNRDHMLAALSGLAAATSVLLVCALWIFTAWPTGAGAAIMVAVACSFFAAQDNPAPAIAGMVRSSSLALICVGIYSFAVLPRVTCFEELYLVLLPIGMIIGLMISRPSTFALGMNLSAIGATQMAMENGYVPGFVTYANSSIAVLTGLGSALVMTRLIRSFGAAWTAERLMRASWREIAEAAEGRSGVDAAMLIGITVDRLGLMVPRLAAISANRDASLRALLGSLRVGLNMLGLHRELWRMPLAARRACEAVFTGVAAHYRADPRRPAPPALQDAIDESISLLAEDPHSHKTALMMLSGLRCVLFPAAPPPQIAPWTEPARRLA